jgi:hypothetical protein
MRRNSLQLAEKERIIREFVSMHKLNVGPNMVTPTFHLINSNALLPCFSRAVPSKRCLRGRAKASSLEKHKQPDESKSRNFRLLLRRPSPLAAHHRGSVGCTQPAPANSWQT